MKKLYYVRTNAYDMIVSDDGEVRRVFTGCVAPNFYAGFGESSQGKAREILEAVEDDSGWETFEETVEELTAESEILATLTW